MNEPRWVFIGDTHGDTGWMRTVLRSAARAGVRSLIHVGDDAFDWPGRNRPKHANRVNHILEEHGQTLYFSGGNHDNWTTLLKLKTESDGLTTWRPNIRVFPRGGRAVVEGLTVGALGGAFSIDARHRTLGMSWWDTEEPTREDAQRLLDGGPVDVLVTHDVPLAVPIVGDFMLAPAVVERANVTRQLLQDVVDQLRPGYVFCGHWHQRLTHELVHPDGSVTTVEVLANEYNRRTNAVLLSRGERGLVVEPLDLSGN
ncbi:metallophosphoesterase family protein [Pseudarthrobacter niigatensis]|uniref:metallophosphoesterase family protein n=1 Tax=Pseudarthrobacter niigatensis TaxID=369935 RepID=UPI0027D8B006|nr:metallophosphoesterase [Pseudarthrobacter niigatensis]